MLCVCSLKWIVCIWIVSNAASESMRRACWCWSSCRGPTFARGPRGSLEISSNDDYNKPAPQRSGHWVTFVRMLLLLLPLATKEGVSSSNWPGQQQQRQISSTWLIWIIHTGRPLEREHTACRLPNRNYELQPMALIGRNTSYGKCVVVSNNDNESGLQWPGFFE